MYDIYLLAIGSLFALVASYFSFREKKSVNSKKGNGYNIVLFLVIIVGIVTTFLSGLNSLNEKKESDRERNLSDSLNIINQRQLQIKSDQIIKIQGENFDRIQKLNDSLSLAKNEIINLQKVINNNITGSSDPCYMVFQTSSDNKGYTIIINESNLPIFDLTIYISDFNELLKCKNSKFEDKVVFDEPCYKKCTEILRYDFVNAGNSNTSNYYLPLDKNEGALEIRFSYKSNIEYLEQLVFRRAGNNIKCKARLFRLKGYKYQFLKYIDQDKFNWKVNFDEIFNLPLTSRNYGPIYWR